MLDVVVTAVLSCYAGNIAKFTRCGFFQKIFARRKGYTSRAMDRLQGEILQHHMNTSDFDNIQSHIDQKLEAWKSFAAETGKVYTHCCTLCICVCCGLGALGEH